MIIDIYQQTDSAGKYTLNGYTSLHVMSKGCAEMSIGGDYYITSALIVLSHNDRGVHALIVKKK